MPVVRCARSGVQAVGNPVKLFLAEDAQVNALGQVLTHNPVRVFTGATLPEAVRVAEVDLQASMRSQIDVSRPLPALVVGEALAQRRGS